MIPAPRQVLAALAAGCLALGTLLPLNGQERPTPRPAPARPGASGKDGTKKETPPGKPAASRAVKIRRVAKPTGAAPRRPAASKAPPERVALPRPGVYRAAKILRLAGKLAGRALRVDRKEVQDAPVNVSPAVAETPVTLEEIAVVLGACHVYLFLVDDPEEGRLLVASSNPHWRYEPRRHRRLVETTAASFPRIAEAVRKAVEKRNEKLPRGAEPMTTAADPRTGKIFLCSPRRTDIDAVLAAVQAARQKTGDSNRPRLYVYQGHHRRARDLRDGLLKKLQEAEVNRLRVVLASRGNRILFRCPSALGEKVLGILNRLDRDEPSRVRLRR